MRHDQHVACFEALRKCAHEAGPTATLGDDVQRDQMLRSRKHDMPEGLSLGRPRHPRRGRLDEKQHRATEPDRAQHVRKQIEPGRRAKRFGRSVMAAGHREGDLNTCVALEGSRKMQTELDVIRGMYSAFARRRERRALASQIVWVEAEGFPTAGTYNTPDTAVVQRAMR